MTTAAKEKGPVSATPPATTKANELALYKRDVVDAVASKVQAYIQSGEINLPANYSPNNALKSAWLILQNTVDRNNKPAMEVCTRNSVANALLDLIVQGLNPGKKQAYLIVYGNQLVCQRSYFGSMAVAQMVNPSIAEFSHAIVYEGDTFKYGIRNGKKEVVEHIQELENIDKKNIKAAYCIALDKAGNPLRTEIMTMEEIKQAWKQSKMKPVDDKGNVSADSTHGKFTSDMAMKTVINKTCKLIINASSDNALLLDRINRNEDLADAAEAQIEIDENANTGEVIEIVPETVNRVLDAVPETADESVTGTIKCPDTGGMVIKAACPPCSKREGCPSWDEPKEPVKKIGKAPNF